MGIGPAGLIVQAYMGARHDQRRRIRPDESWARWLAHREWNGADQAALRGIGIERSAAPAGIPQRAFGINDRAIDTALFGSVVEDAFVGYRQSGFGVRINPPDDVAIRIGKIGDLSVRGKADRIGDRDAGKQLF